VAAWPFINENGASSMDTPFFLGNRLSSYILPGYVDNDYIEYSTINNNTDMDCLSSNFSLIDSPPPEAFTVPLILGSPKEKYLNPTEIFSESTIPPPNENPNDDAISYSVSAFAEAEEEEAFTSIFGAFTMLLLRRLNIRKWSPLAKRHKYYI